MCTHNDKYNISNVRKFISNILAVPTDDILDIRILKKGMTNRSFLFSYQNSDYILRIPGEGTDRLINRKAETEVYNVIGERELCDNVIYINPENGYKITEFFYNARTCNSDDVNDLRKCMETLKKLHDMHFVVENRFDLFEQLDFYESLWGDKKSVYCDYTETKRNVYKLKKYIDGMEKDYCLTHIDAVPDNFLFLPNGDIRLIDWEYAGMQDPHVDIAMFCIYSLYDRERVDRLIDIYFENNCSFDNRIKIYCYISVCGLLWSNWCEYKSQLGVEFGEYSLWQYRYAEEYYNIVVEELGGSL